MEKRIEKSKFHLGDIVCLKSALSGIDENIPHLVVLEAVKEHLNDKRIKYRCMWFTRFKKWEFKETWLFENQLVLSQSNDGKTEIMLNEVVFLKTKCEELTYSYEDPPSETITVFCPPSMTVIGFETVKNFPPIFDNQSNVMREISEILVKCLYYNPIANKFSEILLPLESLEK